MYVLSLVLSINYYLLIFILVKTTLFFSIHTREQCKTHEYKNLSLFYPCEVYNNC